MTTAPHRARALRVIPAGVLLALVGVLAGPGCGTDAVGIDDCREIERARCEAASHCGLIEDVEECQRFYRDHCLHGLSVESPGAIVVESCVSAIRKAGECARDFGGVDASLGDCKERPSEETADADQACDLVLHPERAAECRFLTPNPPEPSGEGGGTGEGGAPGSGVAGESGAPGQAGSGGQRG